MRIYTTGTGALWPIFLGVGIVLLVLIGLGGFLLTTPLGLGILVFWGLSSLYRGWQRKNYRRQYASEQQSWQSDYENNAKQQNWQENSEEKSTVDTFATYRQEESTRGMFTADDLRNAQDVEFKEL